VLQYNMNTTITQIIKETGMSAKEINEFASRFLDVIVHRDSYNEGDLLKAKFLKHYTGMMI